MKFIPWTSELFRRHSITVNPRILLLAGLAMSGINVASQTAHHQAASTLDQDQALQFSQAAIDNTPQNYRFFDRDGNTVMLADYRGKPLVISLIYTSCYHTCPAMTTNLKNVVEVAIDAVGMQNFSVITIGFDTAVDTPERMRIFAAQRSVDLDNWEFLSTDADTIAAITRELGFIFIASPKGFDHLAQTTILDAGGKVYRQVYGEKFDAPQLVEPLKELLYDRPAPDRGAVAGWIDGIRLFCTLYDPSSGRYYFDYSVFVMFGTGLISLVLIAIFIIRAWREHDHGRPAG